MNETERQKIIDIVVEREKLRPLSRLERLRLSPWRTIPYYFLATLSHLRPYPLSFKTLWGTKMTCYLPEGNTFYFYGYCEANLTNFFIRYVQEGMTVIDIGAHIGIYSMLSSELVGLSGRVYSFEPTPWTFKILKTNTEKLANVTIFNQAVSDTAQTLTFQDYGPGYGAYNSANSAGATGINKKSKEITVDSVALDTFCREKSIRPDLIKIDAEGFEYEVLKGSQFILGDKTNKRPIISMEVAGDDKWADNRRRSFAILNENQYVAYEINQHGLIAPHQLKDDYRYDNLLFIPQERISEMNKFFS